MEERVEYKLDAFFCPVAECEISEYDCREISFGAKNGYYINDGLPYFMPIETVIARKDRCRNCTWNQNHMGCPDVGKLNEAIQFATKKHSGQKRKGTDIPYIVHPLETMTILSAMNGDITLLMAGVLHDVVEDTDATIEEIRELFGDAVARLVGAHSEDKSRNWKERKEMDIRATKEGSRSLKMLVMADKVSNLRALHRDVARWKELVWDRFNAPEAMQAWYYSKLIDALEDMQNDADTVEIYWEMVGLFKDIFVAYYYGPSETLYQISDSGEKFYLDAGNPEWRELAEEMPEGVEKISRKCAERIEDNWADALYGTIRNDIRDAEYELFASVGRELSIEINQEKLVLKGEDYGKDCERIGGIEKQVFINKKRCRKILFY